MKKNYPITATFLDEITYDIPSSNWTRKQWCKDLDHMKKVGIDTIVFIRGGFYDKAVFPSKHFSNLQEENDDFAGMIFQEAAKRNMKVFMGLYISNITWNDGDAQGEIEKNKVFVEEVLERYGNMPSFEGWYIPHETCDRGGNIKETMGGLAALCKEKSPDKKVLVSPFFRTSVTLGEELAYSPERMAEEWDEIWEYGGQYIDYCAFQDGTAPLEQLADYFIAMKRVCDKYNMQLWANVETFERDVRRMYYPIPFDLLRKKINVLRPYVDKMMTFEFSHFLSPQSIYPSARNLNKVYRQYYKKK